MPILRRVVQVVVFLVFLVLLVHVAAVVRSTALPAEAILRLSPLAGLTTMLGSAAWIPTYFPALVVLVLAVLFGRFFCGWVCPLGSTLDATDHVLTHARKGRTPSFYDGRRLKYYLLALLVVGAPLGIRIAGWFDPLSLITRSFGLVVVPYVTWLCNSLSLALHDLPSGPLGGWWQRGSQAVLAESGVPAYQQHAVFAVLLFVLLALGIWYRRYWCRNLCPLGALLGIVSGRNLLRRSVDGKCIACHKCERVCPMACISDEGRGTMTGECILCLRCQEACPTNAVHFLRAQPRGQDVALDLTKRGFLATMGATVAALPFLRTNVPRRRQKDRMTVLRPPGARPEDDFLARCVRCGECMRVCPTRALQPTAFEAGIEGLWTPRLVPRIGYCVYNCTLCGQVCPSQAIRQLDLDEKHTLALGKAKFNRSRCIPWVGHARFREGLAEWQDANCGTCEEACPVPGKAIRYNRFVGKVGDKEIHLDRPYVVEELCVGCGFCENVCPVAGEAAIRVEGPAGTAAIAEEAESAAAPGIASWDIEGWALAGQPKVYAGPKQLYEYINGAGEPYLTYAFVQVTVARYTRGSQKLTVDLWQFKTPEEAFGAYSRDCSSAATAAEALGDAGGSGEGEVWAWSGHHYLHVTDPAFQAPKEVLLAAAKALLARLPKVQSKLPPVVAALPSTARVPVSVHYFHSMLAAPEHKALPSKLLGPNGLAISDKTHAAFALYGDLKAPTHAVAVVEYPSPAEANAALQRCRKLWPDKKNVATNPRAVVLHLAPNAINSFLWAERHLICVLRAKDTQTGRQAIEDVTRRLGR